MEAIDRAERALIAEEMRTIGRSADDERRGWRFQVEADRFEKCGKEGVIYHCEHDNTNLYTKTRCRSRICDHCGFTFYGQIEKELREEIQLMAANRRKGWYASFLTLTVTSKRFGDRMPTRSDIQRIYRESRDFFRLFCGRYKGVWTKKGKVREDRKHWLGAGAISVVEVGCDNNNLHVHAVVYMPFRPLTQLRREWSKITGDSFGVDIEAIKSPTRAARYIMKYITKGPQTDSLNRLAEYAWMIKGSRRLRTCGMFYNHIRVKHRTGLKCRCPFCFGRLKMLCIRENPDSESNTWPLWRLLRQAEDRGGPLLAPALHNDYGWVRWTIAGPAPASRNELQKKGNSLHTVQKVVDNVNQTALF